MTSSKQEKDRFIRIKREKAPKEFKSRKQVAVGELGDIFDRFYISVVASEVDLWIRADSPYSQWRAFGLQKELHFFDWVNFYIRSNEVVYDVGANVGVMAMTIAMLRHNMVEIHAFEPVPASFGSLQENCVYNGMKKIKCWPVALFDRDGSIEMNLDSYMAGSSLHDLMSEDDKTFNPSPAIALRADSLPDFLDIKPPDHMKIDVDGMEAHVLRGMSELLKPGSSLKTVLIEVDKLHTDEIDRVFLKNGFVQEGNWNHMKNDGTWDTQDILYVRAQ